MTDQHTFYSAIETAGMTPTEDVRRALTSLLELPPSTRLRPQLAGPNEFIDILGNAVFWATLAYVTKPFTDAFLGEAGKATWKKLEDRFAKPTQVPAEAGERPEISEALNSLIAALNALGPVHGIYLGFPCGEATFNGNISLQVHLESSWSVDGEVIRAFEKLTPGKFAEIASMLAAAGPIIDEHLEKNPMAIGRISRAPDESELQISVGVGSAERKFFIRLTGELIEK